MKEVPGAAGQVTDDEGAENPGNVSPLDDPVPMPSNKPTLAALVQVVAANTAASYIGHKRGRQQCDRHRVAVVRRLPVLVACGLVKLLPAPRRHGAGGLVDH